MKTKSKIFVAILTITMILVANTVGVLALQSFTDVADEHWAKKDIEKMADKKIITGYGDATFRPSENIDKLATIVMIFRTLKAADKLDGINVNSLVVKYNMVINQYNIPEWAKEAVAFGLEKSIIDRYDVANFFKNDGTLDKAKRSEVATFLGKAMNLYLKEEISNNIITFDFNDAEFIPVEAAPYVNLLVKKSIVNGDDEGNFNPNNPIMRAAVAKMLSAGYDVLEGIEVDTPEEPPKDDKELTTKEGKIALILEGEKKIIVSSDEGKNNLYIIEDDTEILIENRASSMRNLDEGTDIVLVMDENGRLVRIEVDSNITALEGTFKSNVNMGDHHLVTVKQKDTNKNRTYKANENTLVLLNDQVYKITDLNYGDSVSITLNGDTIDKIIAESKIRTYEGILESNVVFSQNLTINIRTHTQKLYELELDDDVEVVKNKKKKKLTDLYKGDIVTITTEYEKVTKIDATSIEIKGEDEGVITEIILGTEDKITILREDGETKTYVISSDADIEVENVDKTIYDLKLDYKVEFRIENNEVIDIEATVVETSNSITGTITEIYKDYEAITIKVKDGNKTKNVSVLVDDATILSPTGRSKSFSYLGEDYEVFVFGKEATDIFDFVAEKIIVIKED